MTTVYIVWIRTGTDMPPEDGLSIQLFGTRAITGVMPVCHDEIFSFNTGSASKFTLKAPDLGDITHCCLSHNQAASPDCECYIVGVQVKHKPSQREWTFAFNSWLGAAGIEELHTCAQSG
jgi:hypothetical protein